MYNDHRLTYATLQDRPKEFLAATRLTPAALARLRPALAAASPVLSPPDKTMEGQPRQRHIGGGATGVLSQRADKLLCMLVSQKTSPLHTMHGVSCKLRQAQTTSWMQHVLPVLPHAFAARNVAPERDASQVDTSSLGIGGRPPCSA